MSTNFYPTNTATAAAPIPYYIIGVSLRSVMQKIHSAYSPTDLQTIRFTASEGSGRALLNFSANTNMKKLAEIENLEDDWNGYGARKFNSAVIANAKSMLQALWRQPFISPTARQSIQMEFDGKNGDYFEIEVFADSIEVYTSIGSQEEELSLPVEAASYKKIAEMAEQFNG